MEYWRDGWAVRVHILKVYAGDEVGRHHIGYEWAEEFRDYVAGDERWAWEPGGRAGVFPTPRAAYDDWLRTAEVMGMRPV